MTQLSREKLKEIKYRAETQGINAGYLPEEILTMVDRLLAAEAQEPYGYVHKWLYEDVGSATLTNDHEAHRDSRTHIPLYAAPQPVAVPDERVLLRPDEIERHTLTAGDCPPQSKVMLVSSINRLNACRAAMLNAEPVSQPYTLPQWIPCSERMPEAFVDVSARDGKAVFAAYHARLDGKEEWVVISELAEESGEITHWMPLPAAPQEPTK